MQQKKISIEIKKKKQRNKIKQDGKDTKSIKEGEQKNLLDTIDSGI